MPIHNLKLTSKRLKEIRIRTWRDAFISLQSSYVLTLITTSALSKSIRKVKSCKFKMNLAFSWNRKGQTSISCAMRIGLRMMKVDKSSNSLCNESLKSTKTRLPSILKTEFEKSSFTVNWCSKIWRRRSGSASSLNTQRNLILSTFKVLSREETKRTSRLKSARSLWIKNLPRKRVKLKLNSNIEEKLSSKIQIQIMSL